MFVFGSFSDIFGTKFPTTSSSLNKMATGSAPNFANINSRPGNSSGATATATAMTSAMVNGRTGGGVSVNEIRQLLNEVEPDPSEAPSASAILSMLPSSNPVDDWDVSSEFKSDALTHTPLTSGSFTASGMRATAEAPLTSQSPKNGFPPDRTKIRLPRYGPAGCGADRR